MGYGGIGVDQAKFIKALREEWVHFSYLYIPVGIARAVANLPRKHRRGVLLYRSWQTLKSHRRA
jgi:hypothetical protein